MAELICNDGTKIKISDETEQELRKAFGQEDKWVVKIGKTERNETRVFLNLRESVINRWKKTYPIVVVNENGEGCSEFGSNKDLDNDSFYVIERTVF